MSEQRDENSVDATTHLDLLAPFNPTGLHAQEIAILLLSLNSDDILFDLGCGDGRLLSTATQKIPGLRCVGIEIDPTYVARASESLPPDNALIEIREGDVLDPMVLDGEHPGRDPNERPKLSLLQDATAVFVYLLPKGLRKLKPTLQTVAQRRKQEDRPFRVVSYMFSISGWDPVQVDRTTKGGCGLYLYDLSSMLQEEDGHEG
jgi:SAM-dependent methyltransferase